jgi:hypothetical protein
MHAHIHGCTDGCNDKERDGARAGERRGWVHRLEGGHEDELQEGNLLEDCAITAKEMCRLLGVSLAECTRSDRAVPGRT